MKCIWEENDLRNVHVASVFAQKGKEIVMVSCRGVVSLKDGHQWLNSTNISTTVEYLNEQHYKPILKFVDLSFCVNKYADKTGE